MAGYNVPKYNKAEGQKKWVDYSSGLYKFEVKDCAVVASTKAPAQIWTFKLTILEGPPDAEGKSSVGRGMTDKVSILLPEHPSYNPKWDDPESDEIQMGVNDLKSRGMAYGVTAKKNQLNPESFNGQRAYAKLKFEVSKKDGKTYSRLYDWESAE